MKWTIARTAAAVVLLAGMVVVLGLRASIIRSIDEIAAQAREAVPAARDDVTALIFFMGDETRETAARNRAVWALGQLRDPRALPALEAQRREVCRHGEDLCQHELAKAIELCAGDGGDLLRIARR